MEMGQSQAAATLVTYSSISGWVPIVVSSGTKYPNQPKLIRVKSCLMRGASSAGHLRTSFFNTSGLKTSKAFPPLNICRSEEHTSELQSRPHLVCRLLLEKKKK